MGLFDVDARMDEFLYQLKEINRKLDELVALQKGPSHWTTTATGPVCGCNCLPTEDAETWQGPKSGV